VDDAAGLEREAVHAHARHYDVIEVHLAEQPGIPRMQPGAQHQP
jgi:hypothetical protein